MFDELKELKYDTKTLRQFGWLVGGIFLILGAFSVYRGSGHSHLFLWIGAPLTLAGFLLPRLLKHLYKAWMALAIVLGFVMSRVILALVFYGVLTPLALIMRLFGKKFLDLHFPESKNTCWVKGSGAKDKDSYEKQY